MKLPAMFGDAMAVGVPAAIGIFAGFKSVDYLKGIMPGGALAAPLGGLILGSIIIAVGRVPAAKVLGGALFGTTIYIAVRDMGIFK